MWLFLTAVAILVIIYNRGFIQKYAKGVQMNGITIDFGKYRVKYPTYCKGADDHMARFNREYQRTFVYENANTSTINKLFSIRSDVLYQISQIRFRLPNDLVGELDVAKIYDATDRRLMEHISDAEARFNVFINPGQTSSAYAARHYRASNDVVY